MDTMLKGMTDPSTPRSVETNADETVERVALAGAAAIQQLITDRANLRNLAAIQHRDLVTIRAANQDLLGRVAAIRHQYVEFASNIMSQLEQFDLATRNAMQGAADSPRRVPANDDGTGSN
jgi:hypothetical protein